MRSNERHTYLIGIIILAFVIALIFLFGYLTGSNVTGAVVFEESVGILDEEGVGILDFEEFEYVAPDEISREGALEALMEAEEDVVEMENLDLSIYLVQDILLNAKRSFIGHNVSLLNDLLIGLEEDKEIYVNSLVEIGENTPIYEINLLNYSDVFYLTQQIKFKKDQAYVILDSITLLKDKENEYKENEYDTSKAVEFLEKGKLSFKEERYDEAVDYLEKSDLELDKASTEYKRARGLLFLSKNFFERNWWKILIGVIILAIITPPVAKKIKKKRAVRKLKILKLETETIKKMYKKAQEDCFHSKRISEDTYKIKEGIYKKRLAEIKHTIPVLEGIISGVKKKEIKSEKKRGILEIK